MKNLFIAFLCLASMLFATEILENEFLKAVIEERGGKVISLIDKASGRELSMEFENYNGIGKTMDALFASLEPLTVKFELKRIADDAVTATTQLHQSTLAGLVISRTFRLPKGEAALFCSEKVQSKEKENSISVKFHNMISFTEDTVFTLPSKRGYSVLPYHKARTDRLSVVTEISKPWLAGLDGKSGRGVALYVNTPEQLKNMFQWNAKTLEATFAQVTLKPVAEADEWSATTSIIPFAGKGNVVEITPDYVFTKEGTQGTIFFIKSLGKCTATMDGKTIGAVEAKAGTCYVFKAEGKQLLLASHNRQLAVELPSEYITCKPLLSLPKQEAIGINGYYYFYPEMWLSDEIDSEVHIGLRGNFTKMKNFRLMVALPEGVDLPWSLNKFQPAPDVVIKGKKLHCVEIFCDRRVSYASSVEQVHFRPNKAFKEDSVGYVYAIWDGGQQQPNPIIFKKIPKLPDIGDGLKHFIIGLGSKSTRPTPEWRKCGINFYNFYDYMVPIFINDCMPSDFYTKRLKEAEAAGLRCGTELSALFSRFGNVLNGQYLKGHGTIFFPEKKFYTLNPKEFQAINSDGVPVPFVCPSYMGPYWEKTLDILRVAKYYGFKSVTIDDETWANGETLCYCPRCLKKFGKDPAKYPQEWLDFKTDQIEEMYRQMRETVGEDMELSTWLDKGAPKESIRHRLSDYSKISKYVDYVKPMVYTAESAAIGRYSHTISELIKGKRAKLIMGLSPNRMYEYYRVASKSYASLDAMREQILEAIFNGAVGVHVWNHFYGFQAAMGFYSIALAVRDLMPVEDIIFYGKPVKISSSNPDVMVSAYEYKGEYAIFARNYDRGVVKTTVLGKEIVFDKDRVAVLKVKK